MDPNTEIEKKRTVGISEVNLSTQVLAWASNPHQD